MYLHVFQILGWHDYANSKPRFQGCTDEMGAIAAGMSRFLSEQQQLQQEAGTMEYVSCAYVYVYITSGSINVHVEILFPNDHVHYCTAHVHSMVNPIGQCSYTVGWLSCSRMI